MPTEPPLPPASLDAVIFDFNDTIARIRDVPAWLRAAREQLDRAAEPDPDRHRRQVDFLTGIWAHARTIDPTDERDLSTVAHRRVSTETLTRLGGFDPALAAALYDTMAYQFELFAETPEVLRSLRAGGIRVGLLSNIGLDIRPCLASGGILDLFDTIVLSYEVGMTKPDPAIFTHTLTALGARAERTLMVGDSARDDTGGASLGSAPSSCPPHRDRHTGWRRYSGWPGSLGTDRCHAGQPAGASGPPAFSGRDPRRARPPGRTRPCRPRGARRPGRTVTQLDE